LSTIKIKENKMELLITIAIPLVGALIVWIISKILPKLKLSIDTQIKVLEIVRSAVLRVEDTAIEYAKTAGKKMPSDTKLMMCLNFIDNAVKEYPEIEKYIRGKERELVERLISSSLTPIELSPKDAEK
jgi:hypothetical protein